MTKSSLRYSSHQVGNWESLETQHVLNTNYSILGVPHTAWMTVLDINI